MKEMILNIYLFTFVPLFTTGKTSLLNSLSGVTKIVHGNCFVFGFDMRQDLYEIQTMTGSAPQDDLLYPELTAEEHVIFYAKFRGLKLNQSLSDYVAEKLAQVGLEERKKSKVRTFSGGMKRRLVMILATVGEPKIVFLVS